MSGLVGSLAVALLVALSPSALAAHPSLTLKAPYTGGVVNPSNNPFMYGCGYVKVVKGWGFSLSKGIGGSDVIAKSITCQNAQYGYGANSQMQDDGYAYIGIPFHVSARATHVQVNLSATWSLHITTTDGGKAACGNYNKWDDTYVSSGWGYTTTPVGNYYAYTNYSYWDQNSWPYNTQYSNGSSGTAPPVPFHFNSTSELTWTHNWGGYADCYANVQTYFQTYGYLYDESNGSYISQSANTMGSGGLLFNVQATTTNYTYWNCQNQTNWNGPSASWSNTSLTCNSYNQTVTSYWYNYVPTTTHGSSNNNSNVITNTTTDRGSWFWNYTLNAKHKYELVAFYQGYYFSNSNWPRPGAAEFSVNMGTLGNSYKIESISSY